jgi:hypothetical protein
LTEHNHSSNPDKLLSTEFKAKINKRAETSTGATQKLDVHPVDASAISTGCHIIFAFPLYNLKDR